MVAQAVALTGEHVIRQRLVRLFSTILKREGESFGAPIRQVINTHHHADHTGGNVGFTGQAQVWANPKAMARVEAQVDRYLRELAGGAGTFRNFPNPTEDWMLEEADKLSRRRSTYEAQDWVPGQALIGAKSEVSFGGRMVEAYHVGPGHTDNDVYVRVPEANVVHAGDLFFNGMHPYYDPNGGGSSAGWVASLEGVIKVCDDETVVVPGHGALSDLEGLKKAKAYHEQLREAVAAAIDEGKGKEEIVEMRWAFMEGLGRDQLRPRAISFVYEEMKAGGE